MDHQPQNYDELDNYLTMINDLRGQVIRLIEDLSAEALNWRPIDNAEDDHATNSLAVLAAHIAGAEHYWIAELLGGRPRTRRRPEEFETVVQGPQPLVERLREVGRETEAVFAQLTPDRLNAMLEGSVDGVIRPLPARWAILHVIDHTALHLGHMQITYQLWMGGKSGPSPRWYERVPRPS
ncbi:MAG: DUF664 domain-containing protein [Chloroflexi bacterium]|nr:DUF664 domain-containing protein [Chloroflexota bacterium]